MTVSSDDTQHITHHTLVRRGSRFYLTVTSTSGSDKKQNEGIFDV